MERVLNRTAARKSNAPGLWEARDLPQDEPALADEQYHDAVAESYDDWESIPWMAHAEAWIVPWIVGHARDGIVVDFGTGTGRIARALAQTGSVEVIAVDRSRRMLEVALAKTAGQPVLALRADVTDLPILDGSVDAVTCSGVLHHMQEPQRAVEEAARILRPGGRFVVREPNADYPASWFAPLEGVLETMHRRLSARSSGVVASSDGETSAKFEDRAPIEHPVSPELLREWLGFTFVPEFVGSAKFLASLSLPVGIRGENIYYRLANRADRACLLRLLPRHGSLVLAVARRTERHLTS